MIEGNPRALIVLVTGLIINPMPSLRYSPPNRKGNASGDLEEAVKYPPDASSHNYEVKKVDKDDAVLDAGTISASALHLYGFNPIRAGGSPVTNEMVNKLRDQLGI